MKRVLSTLVVLLFACAAHAHNPGLSTLKIEAKPDRVEFTLQFAPPDQDGDGRASPKEIADGATLLRGLVARWLVYSDERGDFTVSGTDLEIRNADEMVVWRAAVPGVPTGKASVRLQQLNQLSSGHREFTSVVRDGTTVVEALLSSSEPSLSFTWPSASTQPGAELRSDATTTPMQSTHTFADFVKLGIEHILTGYDHLLYLAGLILVCRRFRSILPIITSFTVAHSLTLGLATVGAVSLPSSFVEPMIAASIVYVGVENLWLRGREPRFRWLGAFLFGLIHGFGFAGLLREMGVGNDGHSVLVPLFSFNFGVELGQLTLVAVALPFLTLARRQPRVLTWALPASSILVSLVGLYWFTERVLF